MDEEVWNGHGRGLRKYKLTGFDHGILLSFAALFCLCTCSAHTPNSNQAHKYG
ncbi:hypothetical protein KI387_023848, partial [Taxus chinensis]